MFPMIRISELPKYPQPFFVNFITMYFVENKILGRGGKCKETLLKYYTYTFTRQSKSQKVPTNETPIMEGVKHKNCT